jgi:hypothetical protein
VKHHQKRLQASNASKHKSPLSFQLILRRFFLSFASTIRLETFVTDELMESVHARDESHKYASEYKSRSGLKYFMDVRCASSIGPNCAPYVHCYSFLHSHIYF